MSRRLTFSFLLALASSVGTAGSSAGAQQLQVASRGPRFIVAGTSSGSELDASGAMVLHRRVTLELSGVTTDQALKEITRQADLEITYSPRVVALERRVSLHARDITVAAALTEILLEAGVDVSVTTGGQLALVKRVLRPAPPVPAVDSGAVAGRVTDAESGSSLVGATVTIEDARRSARTDADGRYRIGALAPGSYTVRARYIGYTPAAVPVIVGAGEEATADFALARSPHELNQMVVTGTIVPTELKAVPTPVSVINESEIAVQRPHTVQQLFRQVVPGAVSWNLANNYYITPFSTRGSSTLTGGTSGMKVFVDGIQTALSSVSGLDPNSIERIEVIRGPQAAAIYGSDAIGGVIQYFTKRGDPSLTRPQVSAEAALGLVQTPYAGIGTVVRQGYRAAMRGGVTDVSYNLGAGYWRLGDYLPNGEISRQSNPSVYGGMRFARGIVTVDVSGRYYSQNFGGADNPELAQTGYPFVSKPFYTPQQVVNQTTGARLGVAPTGWWEHTVTVGLDRYTIDYARARPRLTFPGDTLLQLVTQHQTRTSIGYNTSLRATFSRRVSGSLTAGFDHYSLPSTLFFTAGALNTTGAVQFAPGQTPYFSRTFTNNTGYFAQGQLGIRDALFLTAAVRAEQNSDFGDSVGTPISPRVGATYVQQLGGVTVKLRGAWGRAIKAPAPGLKSAVLTASSATLANPQLGPERQQGWDGGLDILFGSRGSLSVTYYDQTVDNLIQSVLLQTAPVRTDQYQNVGSAKNRGVEVEGRLAVSSLDLKAQYAYTRARIEALAPGYVGDLQVGDQIPSTPKQTAGASLTLVPYAGSSVSAGVTYVGSWRNFDFLALYGCFGGTRPCQPSTRGYVIEYPSFVKVNAIVTQRLTQLLSGFLSVDNLTNSTAYELSNSQAVMGRITTFGLQLHF